MATDREKILQTAQKYVSKKRYDKAIEEYQKIVRQDPEDARTLLKIGDLQSRMQAYPEAIATYDRVGHYYAAKGFALKAIAVYKQIRELIRKHAPDHANRYGHIVPKLAEIYTQLGLTSDALSAYDEVASQLQQAGRDREAIGVFHRMVDLDMANPLPHLRLAEACCRIQDLDHAIESFWAAAELLLGMGRHDDALKVVERILHFRQDPRYARVAAELYLRRNTREDGLQAIAKLQICFQADPRDLDTLGLLAEAFAAIGDEAKTIEVHKEMARIAREQGNQDLFNELLERLLAVAPDDEQVRALKSMPPSTRVAAGSVSHDEIESVPDAAVEQIRPPRSGHPVGVESRAPQLVVSTPADRDEEEDLEGEAEHAVPDSFDPRAHARKAITDAESFRKLRLFSKSIEALRIALELDPRSVEIRDKLCQVLQESGDIETAIEETVTLAALYIDLGAPEHGQTLLYEVLQLAPEHRTARQMLEQIQGGVPAAEVSWQEPGSAHGAGSKAAADQYGRGGPEDEPLPSFGLDTPGLGEPGLPAESAHDFAALQDVDDPFADIRDGPLPSFGLNGSTDFDEGYDEPNGDFDNDLGLGASGPALPGVVALDEEEDETHTLSVPPDLALPGKHPAPPGMAVSDVAMEAIEEALEEAEFFASRGLYDDAKGILEEQLRRTPGHPLLLERLQAVERSSAESGTIDRTQMDISIGQIGMGEDRAFDIAASLDALDRLEDVGPGGRTGGGFGSAHEEVNVDQVFAKFKAGVRAQVSESDASTHYDLGVAYREMGLVTDAVTEFELAARDPDRECMCHAMIGMVYAEQGQYDEAAAAYLRGLESDRKSADQELSLYYELGSVKERMGIAEEALFYFKRIARRDPDYRDVQERIDALTPPSQLESSVNKVDDDDFDAVFSELFEST